MLKTSTRRAGTRLTGVGIVAAALMLLAAGCQTEGTIEPTGSVQDETRRGRPKVAWQPAVLKLSAAPGSTQDMIVTLTALENISATSVHVDSALLPFATVMPRRLTPLRKGATASFRVRILVPAEAPAQTVTGTIALRSNGHGHRKGPTRSLELPLELSIAGAELGPWRIYDVVDEDVHVELEYPETAGIRRSTADILIYPAECGSGCQSGVTLTVEPEPRCIDPLAFYAESRRDELMSAASTGTAWTRNGEEALVLMHVPGVLPSNIAAICSNGNLVELVDFGLTMDANGLFLEMVRRIDIQG